MLTWFTAAGMVLAILNAAPIAGLTSMVNWLFRGMPPTSQLMVNCSFGWRSMVGLACGAFWICVMAQPPAAGSCIAGFVTVWFVNVINVDVLLYTRTTFSKSIGVPPGASAMLKLTN